MIILLVVTLFLSSSLLFLVQPMIAKMVLPLLGGTPAVWNTCMVFFQATLLAGYLYVHAATRWLRPRQQVALHIALLAVSLLALPIVLVTRGDPPATGMPVWWLLRVLAVTVGVPFFMASTSSPLLMRWFARKRGRAMGVLATATAAGRERWTRCRRAGGRWNAAWRCCSSRHRSREASR